MTETNHPEYNTLIYRSVPFGNLPLCLFADTVGLQRGNVVVLHNGVLGFLAAIAYQL